MTNINTESIQAILKLLDLSSMESDEKTMWKILLPSMEKAELDKFQDLLEQEVQAMTDLYLKAIKK